MERRRNTNDVAKIVVFLSIRFADMPLFIDVDEPLLVPFRFVLSKLLSLIHSAGSRRLQSALPVRAEALTALSTAL